MITFGCAVDDYQKLKHESDSKIRLEYKPFFELIKESRFKNAYSKVSSKLESAMQNKTVMEEQYNFAISDSPVTIVNKDGITSYNILIERDSISENSFENLVVQVDSLNQTWAYIFEYNSPATVPGALYNMKIFPIEYNATEVNSKITSNCLTVCTIICYSCVGSGQYSDPPHPLASAIPQAVILLPVVRAHVPMIFQVAGYQPQFPDRIWVLVEAVTLVEAQLLRRQKTIVQTATLQ